MKTTFFPSECVILNASGIYSYDFANADCQINKVEKFQVKLTNRAIVILTSAGNWKDLQTDEDWIACLDTEPHI